MKLIAVCLLAFLFLYIGKNKTYTDNEHIKVEMKYSAKITAGQKGNLSFMLKPNAGIHVNTSPMPEIVMEKNSHFTISENPVLSKTKEEYVKTTKPIIFSFSPEKGLAPGTYSLKGKLQYYFCSDVEGWCNRFSQPIDVSIEIVR